MRGNDPQNPAVRPGTQPLAAQQPRRQAHIVRPDSPVPAMAPAMQRPQQVPMAPMAARPPQGPMPQQRMAQAQMAPVQMAPCPQQAPVRMDRPPMSPVQSAVQVPLQPQAPAPQPSAFAARMNKVVGQPQGFSRWNSGTPQTGDAAGYGHPPQSAGPGAALDEAAASAPKTKESRKSKRKSTRLPGLIHIGKGRPDVECSVRDISATGALISLAPTGSGRRNIFDKKADVPDRFWLTLKADRMQVDCMVVRRQGEELGVQFLCAPRMV